MLRIRKHFWYMPLINTVKERSLPASTRNWLVMHPKPYLKPSSNLERSSVSAMTIAYKKIAVHLRDELLEELGDKIDAIILYGSVAMKEADKNSDIDILIVTRDDDRRLYDTISKIRTRIDLENDTLTSLLHFSRTELEQYAKLGSPFLEDVTEKGVTLYGKGILKKIRKSLATKG